MMVSGEPKPLSWEIMWVGVVVPGQRDGDLLSLQTKMKPKAAGKPLLNSRETGVWEGSLRLGPIFSPFAFSSSSFHCHDHGLGLGVWGSAFSFSFFLWPPQRSCSSK